VDVEVKVEVEARMTRRRDDDTVPFSTVAPGNELYHRAMFAIGLSSTAVAAVLQGALRAIGSRPDSITIDELGAMLPEIERRLRLLVPAEDAVRAMGRLRRLLFEWEG
jgi:hypothetical protein